MAENLGSAVLELSTDDTKLTEGIENAKTTTKSGMTALKGLVLGVGAAGAGAVAAVGAAAFDISRQVEETTVLLQAQLDVTAEEAERLGQVALDVFENNFGGSVNEAGAALTLLSQQMDDIEGKEQALAEAAFSISDAFGQPIEEIIAAASTLSDEFDEIDPTAAFDLIAAGFQRGLDKSGDFLESVGEYSNLFADADFSAAEFFSTMESGQEGGMLGTDKIADAVKEFQVRITDGSKDVVAGLEAVGLDVATVYESLKSGDATMKDIFDDVVVSLNAMEDPIERNRAAVQLFGTQAEDLGPQFTEGIDTGLVSLEEMRGSAEDLAVQYDEMGSSLGGVWREILVAISPLTDKILDLITDLLPKFSAWLTENIPAMSEWFTSTWTAAEPFVSGFATGAVTIFSWLQDFWAWLSANETLMVASFLAIGAAIVVAMGPVSLAVAAISGIVLAVGLIKDNWDTIEAYFTTLWENVNTAFSTGWTNLVTAVLTPWVEAVAGITTIWSGISQWFTDLWNNIGTAFSTAWDQIYKILFPEVPYSEQIKAAWGAIVASIGNIFKEAGNSAIDVLNDLVALMNTALKKWNELSFSVAGFSKTFDIPFKGKTTIGWEGIRIGTPDIPLVSGLPKFSVAGAAVGGIFTQPSLAAIAEGGKPEGVFPLSRISEFTDAIPGAAGGAGKRELHVHVENAYGVDNLVDQLNEAWLDGRLRGLQDQLAGVG